MIEDTAILEQLAQVDSTNAELLRRLRAGMGGPMAIYALAQTAGRGRNGKSWDAPVRGLYYSQTLQFRCAPKELAGLSLALGIAAVDAIQEAISPAANLKVMLKWPNDIWISQQKLGGILIELAANSASQNTALTTLVAGIGINLAGADGDDRTDLAKHGVALEPPTLATILVKHWQQAALRFSSAGFADFQADWAALDALAGHDIALSDSPSVIWHALGVGPDGALLLRGADGHKRLIASGEVSLSTRLSFSGAREISRGMP